MGNMTFQVHHIIPIDVFNYNQNKLQAIFDIADIADMKNKYYSIL